MSIRMDTRNGQIYTSEQVSMMGQEDRRYMKPMAVHPTPLQRVRGRVGRNELCPCGSSKKFKKCCLGRSNA